MNSPGNELFKNALKLPLTQIKGIKIYSKKDNEKVYFYFVRIISDHTLLSVLTSSLDIPSLFPFGTRPIGFQGMWSGSTRYVCLHRRTYELCIQPSCSFCQ